LLTLPCTAADVKLQVIFVILYVFFTFTDVVRQYLDQELISSCYSCWADLFKEG